MMTNKTMNVNNIDAVKRFWESNPLFSGESSFEPGSRDFFEEHRLTVLQDVMAGEMAKRRFFPRNPESLRVLDLGCGIGFWTIEMQLQNPRLEMHAADLTVKALEMTSRRLELYRLHAGLSQQDAERMGFKDSYFDHVNCQGVIHHTPDTRAAVKEIARVLKAGGTANISVYYKNVFLRTWGLLYPLGRIITRFGGKLRGRDREDIFLKKDTEELVRCFDGADNPVGRAYSFNEIEAIVTPYFNIEHRFLFFFPARALPIHLPGFIHRFLQCTCGFMIHLNLIKK